MVPLDSIQRRAAPLDSALAVVTSGGERYGRADQAERSFLSRHPERQAFADERDGEPFDPRRLRRPRRYLFAVHRLAPPKIITADDVTVADVIGGELISL
jgi:hypothetical protein